MALMLACLVFLMSKLEGNRSLLLRLLGYINTAE